MHHPGTNEQVNFTPQKYVKDAVTSKRSDDVQQHLLINAQFRPKLGWN